MTEEQAIKELHNTIGNGVNEWDIEETHIACESILLEFLDSNGFSELSNVYEKISSDFGYSAEMWSE